MLILDFLVMEIQEPLALYYGIVPFLLLKLPVTSKGTGPGAVRISMQALIGHWSDGDGRSLHGLGD